MVSRVRRIALSGTDSTKLVALLGSLLGARRRPGVTLTIFDSNVDRDEESARFLRGFWATH